MYSEAMRLILSLATGLLAAASFSEVNYRVAVESPNSKSMRVAIAFDVQDPNPVLAMPNWAPGAYILTQNYKKVSNLSAIDEHGRKLEVDQPDPYRWRLHASGSHRVVVSYDLPFLAADEIGHYSGPSTYLYLEGRKTEACRLSLALPETWKIACGLNPVSASTFVARTYDLLADNPVTIGHYLEDHYSVRGKDHTIALFGAAREKVDRKRLLAECKRVSETETNFFGVAPYDKYVWHFNVFEAPDGAGGLEHLSSTEISLSSGVGPGAVSVLSHEFFHLWNVKRIRSFALGPFDYTQLPKTAALWWLEGVTDYYAHLFLAQNGAWTREQFYNTVIDDLSNVRKNPAYTEVGPAMSSFFVRWENGGRGNSNGYKLSYYDLGLLAGLCLDIEVRSQTGGKKSLNDVEWALWNECKDDQPGFAETEIRNQLVKIGGEAMGPYYDKMVDNGGLPLFDETLAKAGISLRDIDEPVDAFSFTIRPGFGNDGLVIRRSNFVDAKPFDKLDSINGKSFSGMTAAQATDLIKAAMDAGEATLVVVRGATSKTLTIPAKGSRIVHRMKAFEDEDPSHKALREALFARVSR